MPHQWSDEDKRTFKTAALAEVNSHILEAAQESSAVTGDWEFFCECGQPDCRELVTLSLPEYASLRERGEPVLAPSHRLPPGTRLPMLIDAAQELLVQAKRRARQTHTGPA